MSDETQTQDQLDTEPTAEAVKAAELAAQAALARADQPPVGVGKVEAGEEFPVVSRPSRLAETVKLDKPDLEREDDATDAAIDAVRSDRADEDDFATVTEWLLSDTSDVITRKLIIRIGGGDDEPVRVPWIIQAVPIDVIRGAEREAAGNRNARRSGGKVVEYDELKANLRVVAAGTIKPDLMAAARAQGLADPAILIQKRFAFRPGIIAQIAGEVMSISGFDAEDVTTASKS